MWRCWLGSQLGKMLWQEWSTNPTGTIRFDFFNPESTIHSIIGFQPLIPDFVSKVFCLLGKQSWHVAFDSRWCSSFFLSFSQLSRTLPSGELSMAWWAFKITNQQVLETRFQKMAISGWRRGFWFGPLLPPRGQENRNNHKVKKEVRAFFHMRRLWQVPQHRSGSRLSRHPCSWWDTQGGALRFVIFQKI